MHTARAILLSRLLFLLCVLTTSGVLTVVAGCAHRPAVALKGFEPVHSTRAQLEQSFAPQRWAVVIGVASYQDPTYIPLRHAVNDAEEVARILKEPDGGGFDRVITLATPERTTRSAILFELSRLRNDVNRQDTLLVYFSGHGTLEMSPGSQPRLYLVATDTRADDLEKTGIELSALRDFLRAIKPQRKVLILDNCFSGKGKSSVDEGDLQRLSTLTNPWSALSESLGHSEAVLMASTLGGVAQEDDALEHGTYTYYLLQAMGPERNRADANLDGAVTPYEAHDYARARTIEHTGGQQIPEGFFRLVGRSDMYLAGKPNPELAQAAALVYAYGREADNAMSLLVDGRPKGAFPQAIPIEPGARQIVVRNEKDRVVAQGQLHFAPGQIYSVGLLLDELRGYRRFFGLEAGSTLQVAGPASAQWGGVGARIGLISGYRMRGGSLRGLSLAFCFGWTPATSGSWEPYTEDATRPLFDFGARLALRRSLGPMEVAGGWHTSAIYTTAVRLAGDPRSIPLDMYPSLNRWITLTTGPMVWQGYRIDRNILVTLEERFSWFSGSFQVPGGRADNLLAVLSAGIELGF